jgi:tartrate-resistant acid phosphatase type 5
MRIIPLTCPMPGGTSSVLWPFKEWGAYAVLSGFYQVYERLSIEGIPYHVIGAGGGWVLDLREVDPNSQCRYNRDNGGMRVEAYEQQIIFRLINRKVELVDSYSISEAGL